MRHTYLNVLLFCLINSLLFGQNRLGTRETSNVQSQQYLNQEESTYHFFDVFSQNNFNSIQETQQVKLSLVDLHELFIQNPSKVALTLNIDGISQSLLLKEKQLFSENYFIQLSTGEKIIPEKFHFYRGTINGDENTFATMMVGKDFISVMSSNEKGNFEINKAKDGTYSFVKSNKNENLSCANDDGDDHHFENHNEKNHSRLSSANCLELYLEVDNAAYIANGSNTANTQVWVNNIFNNVTTLYENYDVPIVISSTFIWTTADPFASAANVTAMRSAFITRLIGLGTANKIGYLLSTRNLGGGISNGIGGFCNAMNAYPGPCALSTSLSTSVAAYPTYSYSVQNVAHELGHVMGLRHSHACVWNGTNTQIDDCGNVIAANSGNTPEGSCFNSVSPILPGASGGTIMSNCNNLAGQNINFSVGFGPIIGDALFLNFVNASCTTGTNCGIIPPNNDDCLDAIPITLTKTCSVKTYDNNYATQSSSAPLFSCVSQTFYTDIWYSVIVPTSGNFIIETKQVTSGLTDLFMQAYSGNCSSLVQISCDDNSGDLDHALLSFSGRTPGEKIYFRISPKDKPGVDDFGEFGLCAYDASLPCHPDFNALVAFYNATGGPTWTTKNGWISNATNCNVCTWHGVVCDASGRVTALNLGFNNLTGTIPSSITSMNRLGKLNLYSNNFAAGSLPSFLNQFPVLEYVDLGDNNYNGTLPATLGSVPNLRTLYIDNNALTGTLPTNLVNTPMVTMWLNNNQLSGCIPNNYTAFCLRNTVVRLEQNTMLPGNGDFDAYCLNGFGGDFDNDGFCGGSADCDDNNAASFPGAVEICDGKDNDCDVLIDEGIPDVTNNWIGTNGNWNVATNWSTGKIPEVCHNVVINPTTSYNITIPNGYVAKASSVNIGANGNLNIQFNGTLTIANKGEIINSGDIISFGTLNINNPLNTTGIALTNSGTILLNSSAKLNINNAGATALRNNTGATFDNNGNFNIINNHPTNGLYGIDNRGSMSNTGLLSVSNIVGKEIRLAVGSNLSNTDLGIIEVK
jgi:hypothetical protein